MAKNEVYNDLFAKSVVDSVNETENFEQLKKELQEINACEYEKSDKITALLNSEKEYTEKDLKLKKIKHKPSKMILKVAVFFVCFCFVGFLTMGIATGFKGTFLSTIFNPKNGEVVINDDTTNNDFFRIGYVPKGFTCVSEETTDTSYRKNYECDEARLLIHQTKGHSISLDCDNTPQIEIINDMECMFLDNDNSYIVYFKTQEIDVVISLIAYDGVVDNAKKEMTKIVKNIEI